MRESSREDQSDQETPAIPDEAKEALTDEETRCHDRTIERRDKEYAYSDAEAYEMKMGWAEGIPQPMCRNPFVPTGEQELQWLLSAINKFESWLFVEGERLRAQPREQGHGHDKTSNQDAY